MAELAAVPAPLSLTGRHRLLFVIPALSQGGAERQLLELMRRLDPSEFETVLCTFDDDPHYAAMLGPGVRHHQLALKKVGRVGAFRRLIDLLRTERPHLVQSYMDQANLWVRLAAPFAGSPRIITSIRGPWMRWRYLALEGILASHVGSAVIVNSRSTEAEMLDWARIPRERLFVVHNFLDVDGFGPSTPEQRRAARQRYGLADDDLVLLLSGRLAPQKHQLGLAVALGRLHRRGLIPPQTKIVLAGRARDAWYARLVMPAFRRAGVDHLIRQVGTVKASDVPSLYAATDVLLLPSLWEGLPNVALEAHASALPAVVTDKANTDGIVADGETGFEAPLELSMNAYGEALARMLALSPEARAQMGQRGRERVLSLFDPARVLREYLTIYRAVLNDRPLPTADNGRLPEKAA